MSVFPSDHESHRRQGCGLGKVAAVFLGFLIHGLDCELFVWAVNGRGGQTPSQVAFAPEVPSPVAPSLALRVGCWWRRKAHGVHRTLLVGRTATPFSLDLTSAPLSSWDSVLIFDSWFPKGLFSLAISVASASSSTALSMWHVFSRFLSSSSPGIVF